MTEIIFKTIPKDLAEFQALPEAAMSMPQQTAALAVLALSIYPKDKDSSLQMMNYLRGPREMNGIDKQFIADRFRGRDYVPRS